MIYGLVLQQREANMSRKKATLEITLKSDLCVGSGYSYAGIIDQDICYNENGIPYIPGRRIKGCLRDAAQLIRMEQIEKMFGQTGSHTSTSMLVENAYLKGYDEINQELNQLKKNEIYAKYLTQQKVLDQFTMIKTQTSIDENTGVSKENHLRYTRVLNQYVDGIDKQAPLVFVSEIEYESNQEEDDNRMCAVAKALRHIGYNRNRGLGNVQCRIIETKEIQAEKVICGPTKDTSGEPVALHYLLKNTAPLMLSGKNVNQTEHVIGGQSILGAVAGMYLKQQGATAEDELFQDLFVKGEVIFTNARITRLVCDGDYNRYIPAPLFLNRLKKTKKLVNLVGNITKPACSEYDIQDGNQPKKLKTHYVHFADMNHVDMIEVDTDIVYHHSRSQLSPSGDLGILYNQEVVKEQQYFEGSIIGKPEYIAYIEKLLAGNTLRVGKSKSAQYGTCHMVKTKKDSTKVSQIFEAGDKILVTFTSDALFLNQMGYTVSYQEVRQIVAEELGIAYEEGAEEHTYLHAKVIGGYYNVWNLKKPSVPAVAAGSVIEYIVKKRCEIKTQFVGERNLEGFGEIQIFEESQMSYEVESCPDQDYVVDIEPEKSKALLIGILTKELQKTMKQGILEQNQIQINASSLGRVSQMLEDSIQSKHHDMGQAYEDFRSRVNTIKDQAKKSKVESFLKNDMFRYIEKNVECAKICDNLYALGMNKEEIGALWGFYLKLQLTRQKYLLKQD